MTRKPISFLVALSVAALQAAPSAAQTVRAVAPVAPVVSGLAAPGITLAPSLGLAPSLSPVSAGLGQVSPSLALPSLPSLSLQPSLKAQSAPQHVPTAVVVSQAAPSAVVPLNGPVSQVAPAAAAVVRPVVRAAHAAAQRISRDESVKTAVRTESSPSERSASLGKVFDNGAAQAPAVTVSGLAGGLSGVEARDFNAGYGLYTWLSQLPEISGLGAGASLGAARVLLAVHPLLEKGPIFVMKEGAKLTAMSAKDAQTPPVVVELSADKLGPGGASPQAKTLAQRIEAAQAEDKAEGTFFNTAALMNKLGDAARPAPVLEKPAKPELVIGTEMPIDPQRQPAEYLERMLSKGIKSTDPYEVLSILKQAGAEARQRLNQADASIFLERVFLYGTFQAKQLVPGLFDEAQQAASVGDKAGVDKAFKAVRAFIEYAPELEIKAEKAYDRARGILELIERFGQIDEETGLPVSREIQPAASTSSGAPAR